MVDASAQGRVATRRRSVRSVMYLALVIQSLSRLQLLPSATHGIRKISCWIAHTAVRQQQRRETLQVAGKPSTLAVS